MLVLAVGAPVRGEELEAGWTHDVDLSVGFADEP